MLSDIELFIVTWIFGGLSFISIGILLYALVQIIMHKDEQKNRSSGILTKIRLSEKGVKKVINLSMLIIVLCSVAGVFVKLTNVLPFTEYNDETALFRILSAPLGIFISHLILGGIIFYFSNKLLKEGLTLKDT